VTDRPKRASPPWRRFLRFSVRGLIVVVLAIGCWLGWIIRSARIQREAAAAIEQARGFCVYEWQYDDLGIYPYRRPAWPEWLVDRLGEDYFGHVVFAQISRVSLEEDEWSDSDQHRLDAALARVGYLSRVVELNLNNIPVDDAGLTNLKRLTSLKTLRLTQTKVTDLTFVQTMKQLEELTLNNSSVRDAGLARLRGLNRLRSLELVETNVTDVGLAQLKSLTGLKELYIGDTKVTDAGVKELQQALPNLKIAR
jgi:internalin A